MAGPSAMDMEKRLDMSLDDVIKQNAKQTAGKGRGQERNGKAKKGGRQDSARRDQSRAKALVARQGGVSAKRKHPLVLDHAQPSRPAQRRNSQARPQQTVTNNRRASGSRQGPYTGPVNLQVTIRNQQVRPPARSLPMPTGYTMTSAPQAAQQPYYRANARAPAQQLAAMTQQRQQPAASMYGASAPAPVAASYLRNDVERGDTYTPDPYGTAAAGMRMDQYQAAFARAQRGQQVYAGQ